MEVFMSIGLSPRDVDMLYTAFWDIDADNSGFLLLIFMVTKVFSQQSTQAIYGLLNSLHTLILSLVTLSIIYSLYLTKVQYLPSTPAE